MPPAPVTSPDVLPTLGQAVKVRFDGADTVVWWGPGPDGREVVAAHEGQLLTWPSVERAVAHASDAGWPVDWDAGISEEENTLIDFEPAQRRLENDRAPVRPQSALDLWNFTTDVAHTLKVPFNDGGSMADTCHDKLTKATVPAAFGLTEYALRWTPEELKVVRRIMADCVHVVRTAFAGALTLQDA